MCTLIVYPIAYHWAPCSRTWCFWSVSFCKDLTWTEPARNSIHFARVKGILWLCRGDLFYSMTGGRDRPSIVLPFSAGRFSFLDELFSSHLFVCEITFFFFFSTRHNHDFTLDIFYSSINSKQKVMFFFFFLFSFFILTCVIEKPVLQPIVFIHLVVKIDYTLKCDNRGIMISHVLWREKKRKEHETYGWLRWP